MSSSKLGEGNTKGALSIKDSLYFAGPVIQRPAIKPVGIEVHRPGFSTAEQAGSALVSFFRGPARQGGCLGAQDENRIVWYGVTLGVGRILLFSSEPGIWIYSVG